MPERKIPDATSIEQPTAESSEYQGNMGETVDRSGDEKRMRHLEALALEALGNCLQQYDRFGDNSDAQDRCRKIASQEAQNRYMMGQ